MTKFGRFVRRHLPWAALRDQRQLDRVVSRIIAELELTSERLAWEIAPVRLYDCSIRFQADAGWKTQLFMSSRDAISTRWPAFVRLAADNRPHLWTDPPLPQPPATDWRDTDYRLELVRLREQEIVRLVERLLNRLLPQGASQYPVAPVA